MSRTRAPSVARTAVLAGLLGLSVVSCDGAGRLAPAPQVLAAEPSAPPRDPGVREDVGAAQGHPNVLVIETDDMRWDDIRWMPSVRHLLRDKGLSFENSFAPYPLCCPSRSSFLTGQYTHNHHVYSHREPYGFAAFDDHRTIATVLQAAGYQTALVGKYLNGYGEQPLSTGEPSLHYVPPGWDEWYAGSDHLWDFSDPNYLGGTYSYDKLVQNINGEIQAFPGRYSTDVLAEQTRRLITGFTEARAPWFLWWTPVAPHHGLPQEPDDPLPTRRLDGHFSEWETPGRPDWVKGWFDDRISHGSGTPPSRSAEANTRDKPGYLRKLPELTSAERDATTEVTRQRAESLFALDRQIRRTVAHLRRLGQLENTVIMFTSDNGYYLGEHRKRTGKTTLHEPSLRVPLIITGPDVPHGRRHDPVTTVDLAPTIASYAGTTMPNADGTSILETIRAGDQGWQRPIITEAMLRFGRYAHEHQLGPQPLDARGLRLGRWKLTRYSTGEVELYDLRTDPLELKNLHRARRYAKTLRKMGKLYDRYLDCRREQCQVALPTAWQLTPAESRRLTRHQKRATNRYFGNGPHAAPPVEPPPARPRGG
jgi:N-acetylglucosamine-6-sulfatase